MRRNVPAEDVEKKWIPMHYEEDRPAVLMQQLSWLEDLGFTDTDVVWKYYNFAVYGGRKR
jgi:tRNA (cmo5U34)-methyltransferase